MKVVESLKKEIISDAVKTSVETRTKIVSDKPTSYVDSEKNFEVESKVIAKKDISKVLHGYTLPSAMLNGYYWMFTIEWTMTFYRIISMSSVINSIGVI